MMRSALRPAPHPHPLPTRGRGAAWSATLVRVALISASLPLVGRAGVGGLTNMRASR